MRISIAQMSSLIGGFDQNCRKILDFVRKADREQHADLVLFPELAVCGYPPMDLLDQDCFVELNIQTVRKLQQSLPPDIAVGIGFVNRTPYAHGKHLVNEYAIITEGKLVFEQIKTLLPTYDVFDEARNFEHAQSWSLFEWKGERIGIAICEDVWRETDTPGTAYLHDPVRTLLDQGATLLCVPSASPFVAGKLQIRQQLAARIARRGNVPIVYINAVGANDSIIFDGRSFVMSPQSTIELEAKSFEEDVVVWSKK
jgi:NAD+ synthase (glutamine-hydrolysing)